MHHSEEYGTSNGQTFDYGTEVTILKTGYFKTNYHFGGWNTETNGSGVTYQPGDKFIIKDNVYLYAIWYTAEEYVSNVMETVNFLSYSYQKNGDNDFTFSGLCIRFGGLISKSLWDEIDNNSEILGYGVLFTRNNLNGEKLTKGNETYDLFVDKDSKATPALASQEYKQANGVEDSDNDYYAWNLRVNVSAASYTKDFTAVSYIKTNEGYVYLNQITTSVKTLAEQLLANGSNTYDGSLSYLASL